MKSVSFKRCLFILFVFVFCLKQEASGRPNQDENLSRDYDVSDELKKADNIEKQRLKMVEGVSSEDHPVIIYKEDVVSEDYVSPKNDGKFGKYSRRLNGTEHRRHHYKQLLTDVVIEENPRKIKFDILPEKPLNVLDETETSHEVNETVNGESSLKRELQKRPKKFHHRTRRSAVGEHIVSKRNPYFRHAPKIIADAPTQVQYIYVKHAVAGKKHNGLDIPVPSGDVPFTIGNRIAADENDRVVFSGGRTTSRPAQRPTESIFRDPRPQNFDFSFMNEQRAITTTQIPIFTRRPETGRQQESIFRDPRPENFDFSFMNPQQQQSSFAPARVPAPTSRPSNQAVSSAVISQCVWAIVNCCSSRDSEIRYACFEQNGCTGAFWDINPCADNVRDSFINLVADYYN